MKLVSRAWLETIARYVPGFELSSPPEPLRGGNLNHVWRLRSPHGTLILKHAPPHVASHPEVPLSPDRLAFEARALALFSAGGILHAVTRPSIRPPGLIHYDAGEHFLVCEDAGEGPHLADAINAGQISPDVGRDLGAFIARVHGASAGDATLAGAFNNSAIQHTRLQVQYLAVGAYARAAGIPSVPAFGENAAALGQRLLSPGNCLVMGDLWPPSLLIARTALRIIDWEFVHYGHPLQDLAHLGAHCWMQAHTARTAAQAQRFRAFWASFCGGYRETAAAFPGLLLHSEEALMNVHAGAEILMRCAGPFVQGYCYDGLEPGHRLIREALDQSLRLLTEPPSKFFMD